MDPFIQQLLAHQQAQAQPKYYPGYSGYGEYPYFVRPQAPAPAQTPVKVHKWVPAQTVKKPRYNVYSYAPSPVPATAATNRPHSVYFHTRPTPAAGYYGEDDDEDEDAQETEEPEEPEDEDVGMNEGEDNDEDDTAYPFLFGNGQPISIPAPAPASAPAPAPTAEPESANSPMYIMDRFGNLYPYQPRYAAQTLTPTPKPKPKPKRREIDADDLIKLLLGDVYTGEDEGEKSETKANGEGEGAREEKKSDGNALTRQGLADILTQLAKSEEKEREAADAEAKDAAAVEVQAKDHVAEPQTAVESTSSIPQSAATVSEPPKLRRKSTAPSLNVHKVDKASEEANAAAAIAANAKPTLVDDVKVSAPQLKKKNLPFSPPLNVYEFKTKFIVVLSLPGVSKDFVEIDFHPTSNELVIKGEVQNKYLGDDEDANEFILKVSEQRFGQFERIVKLPAYPGVDDTQIKAKFVNGLLEIKIPKIDEEEVKKVSKKITLEDVPDEELERESSQSYI
jgi:HSP20 family molecular chaperone IbpA